MTRRRTSTRPGLSDPVGPRDRLNLRRPCLRPGWPRSAPLESSETPIAPAASGYSVAVRSRAPAWTSISISAHLPGNSRSWSGITNSTNNSVVPGVAALRTLLRIVTDSASGQSWMTFLSTYASPPPGTRELRHARHRVVEDLRELGFLGQIVPSAHAPELGWHGLPGRDGVEQLAPVLTMLRRTDEAGHARNRDRRVRTQGVGKGIQRVAAVAPLDENAFTDQCPQQPRECVRVGADGTGQFVDGLRTSCQSIGDLQVGRDGNALSDPCAEQSVQHRRCGRSAALMQAAEDVAGAFHDADDFWGAASSWRSPLDSTISAGIRYCPDSRTTRISAGEILMKSAFRSAGVIAAVHRWY